MPARAWMLAALALLALAAGCDSSTVDTGQAAPAGRPTGAVATRAGHDWTRFGWDAQRSNHAPKSVLRTVKGLKRRRVKLPGTVDSSPIYLHDVRVKGKHRDVFFVTTTYGRTLAIEARSGRRLWQFVPRGIGSWQGSARITTTTPVADPGRRYVYAASPNGLVHKLSVRTGREARGRWPVRMTRDSTHEKLASALNVSGRYVLVTTGGYIGDAPPYQGHVVSIVRRSGRIHGVFNSLCANRHTIIQPSSCPSSDSAIWPRAGAVVIPRSHRILTTTGNAPFNGTTDFGDTVLMLSPDARTLLHSFTPSNQTQLEGSDADLGSTAPALVPEGKPRFGVQGGKEGKLVLLDLKALRPVQTIQHKVAFTAPAVAGSTVFTSDFSGTTAYRLRGSRLVQLWSNAFAGTSPVYAGGRLLVFNSGGSGLRIYRPRDGKLLRVLPAGSGHWNSPIAGDGRIAAPEGNANAHATRGVLNIYSR